MCTCMCSAPIFIKKILSDLFGATEPFRDQTHSKLLPCTGKQEDMYRRNCFDSDNLSLLKPLELLYSAPTAANQ